MFGCDLHTLPHLLYLIYPPSSHIYRFSVLIGPINHLKHLISKERLPFSAVYFASLGLTLYFALGLHSQVGSLAAGAVQVRLFIA